MHKVTAHCRSRSLMHGGIAQFIAFFCVAVRQHIIAEALTMTKNQSTVYNLIQASLWGNTIPGVDRSVFEEMKSHGIAALAAPVLDRLVLPGDLRHDWETAVAAQIAHYCRYIDAENSLPVHVPYVILKGTSAAQYYPHPEYRGMGDLDIMTSREDCKTAFEQLLEAGFEKADDDSHPRHRTFRSKRLEVEVHLSFASMNDAAHAQYLDDLIISHINPSHVLPDLINGLTLLEHISHHLEEGLGLRQIIDWMMFTHQCLPDKAWPVFQKMAVAAGLEKLAIVTTRMCEIYLGLSPRSWSAQADPSLCEQLIQYIMASGNFGQKLDSDAQVVHEMLSLKHNPKEAFRRLQVRGLIHWQSAQDHRILRPFAWLYQIGHYCRMSLSRKQALASFHNDLNAAQQKNNLLEALNARQNSKGLVVYQDGEYKKLP